MSDDLISRKALLETLETGKDKVYERKTILEVMQEIVKEQATAFDKEKVIANLREELKLSEIEKERCATENPSQFKYANGYASGVSFGLEIVEKGGIE